jgi:hypothetical protein
MELQPILQLQRGVVVEKAADEALQLGLEKELVGEEDRLPEFARPLQTNLHSSATTSGLIPTRSCVRSSSMTDESSSSDRLA